MHIVLGVLIAAAVLRHASAVDIDIVDVIPADTIKNSRTNAIGNRVRLKIDEALMEGNHHGELHHSI